ncbi:MAG: phosphatidylglycerol lysyltransferase domain-containing protein, partial [Alistipes sp.]|nr:phosphatidylglycerol lysyltransferase domain-containing protein [Alistipes sp.]
MNHEFRDISLADRATIESYTRRAGIRNCDLAFANMFCWRGLYRSQTAVIDGFLVIRFRIDGSERTAYMQPLGDGDFGAVIPALRDDARQLGQRLRIAGLTEEGVAVLRRCGCGDFAFCSRRAAEDYIYRTDDLRTLSGRRYQPKRNHINRFTQLYDYRYEELAPHMLAECMRLEALWRRVHTGADKELNAEQRAMQEAFDNFDALGLRGGCIYVGGRMVA